MITAQEQVFWPQDIGPFSSSLDLLLHELSVGGDTAEVSRRITEHLQKLPTYTNADLPYLRYRAYLLVLLDLLRQG